MSQPDKSVSSTADQSSAWGVSGLSQEVRDLTGTTLGDFQVERLLGRGGMGEVYLARQISLSRPVALKVLRPDLLTKPVYLGRFEAEATAVAKLNHPNIVHVYMLGNVEGVRFIAMEYVQGSNLRDYLVKKGGLDLPLALSIMKQAALAIGAAGEVGLIHRDIKPENLLLTRKGQVKVADFGLCRDQDADRLQLTQPGVTMGTPLYMSPEQAQGHELDHRSDLYSLGVTFYHMFAGEPPFKADAPLAIALKHVKDTPVSLAVHRPDLPPDLVKLVMKLMAKDPKDRYQSAAEMLRDLARIRESLNTVAINVPDADLATIAAPRVRANGDPAAAFPAPSPAKTVATLSSTLGQRMGSFRVNRRTLTLVVLLCLAAGSGWGWYTRPEDLLSERLEPVSEPPLPALWMAPNWKTIDQQKSVEAQYHYALLQAPADDQEAAWIAVPGYFPAARDWAARAYIQLARVLLRNRDSQRLKVFADEIARWNSAQSYEHEKELVTIVQAAAKAVGGDLEGVIVVLKTLDIGATVDPALLELSLEVTMQAMQTALRNGTIESVPRDLRQLRDKFLNQLHSAQVRDPLKQRLG
jgi:serine/threonine-protein kinase